MTPVKYLATKLRIVMIMKLFEILKQILEIMIISESYVQILFLLYIYASNKIAFYSKTKSA